MIRQICHIYTQYIMYIMLHSHNRPASLQLMRVNQGDQDALGIRLQIQWVWLQYLKTMEDQHIKIYQDIWTMIDPFN